MIDLNIFSAVVFYLLVFFFIFTHRKKFIIQSKIIALYKTKLGLGLMDRIAKNYSFYVRFIAVFVIASLVYFNFFRIIIYSKIFMFFSVVFFVLALFSIFKPVEGSVYTMIFTGFFGMIAILVLLIPGALKLLVDPNAQSPVAPIIPGVQIPGSPIYVPFWYGIVSLFIIIVIHEFSHGVLSRVHGIPVGSSGFGMLAIIPIAFVEPDEKKLAKAKKKDQLSIFAAGPFSNLLTTLFVILLASFVLTPVQNSLVNFKGVYFNDIAVNGSAYNASVQANVTYTSMNNVSILAVDDFLKILENTSVGEAVILSNQNTSHKIITSSRPDDESKAYLGVIGVSQDFSIKEGVPRCLFYFLDVLFTLLNYIFIFSLGIGLANLLPIGPVDGGKMLYLVMDGSLVSKHKNLIFKYISLFLILIIAFALLFPIFRHWLF